MVSGTTPETAITYLAITNDSTNNSPGFEETLNLYYKIGDISLLPEWHGNLYLETIDFPSDKKINMGFLLYKLESDIEELEEDPNWENGWDGLECSVIYDATNTESSVFVGRDVYHK